MQTNSILNFLRAILEQSIFSAEMSDFYVTSGTLSTDRG